MLRCCVLLRCSWAGLPPAAESPCIPVYAARLLPPAAACIIHRPAAASVWLPRDGVPLYARRGGELQAALVAVQPLPQRREEGNEPAAAGGRLQVRQAVVEGTRATGREGGGGGGDILMGARFGIGCAARVQPTAASIAEESCTLQMCWPRPQRPQCRPLGLFAPAPAASATHRFLVRRAGTSRFDSQALAWIPARRAMFHEPPSTKALLCALNAHAAACGHRMMFVAGGAWGEAVPARTPSACTTCT